MKIQAQGKKEDRSKKQKAGLQGYYSIGSSSGCCLNLWKVYLFAIFMRPGFAFEFQNFVFVSKRRSFGVKVCGEI
ncbi:hypothetical protein VNO80_03492 [Phaseolus coccineus]|uniref:Uncharacterized protein n=1 Tax=Phaseolus coccineus TaxID=3886 RepID=A0AAN9NS50_PHACN